jgi:hypothetical protein
MCEQCGCGDTGSGLRYNPWPLPQASDFQETFDRAQASGSPDLQAAQPFNQPVPPVGTQYQQQQDGVTGDGTFGKGF